MSWESFRVEEDTHGRYYSVWYNSRWDKAFRVKRINAGIDFKANKEARKCMTPDTYLLYMSLITLPMENKWLLSKLNLLENTTLTEASILEGLQELTDLGYLTLDDKRSASMSLWESPRLKPNQ